MQQEYVISELEEYVSKSPSPADSVSVQEVVLYLKACNQLFERGILAEKGFIKKMDSPLIHNMKKGFKYFAEWANNLIAEGRYCGF